ncbi:MAG: hypothetical protein OHK0017_07860 [Patescibacteria group bacterium]
MPQNQWVGTELDMSIAGNNGNGYGIVNYQNSRSKNYIPIQNKKLQWASYRRILTTNVDVQASVRKWQMGCDSAGSTAYASTELGKRKLYNLLYSTLDYPTLKQEYIEILASEGEVIIMLNDEGKPKAYSVGNFNCYWDETNKRFIKYELLVDGQVAKDPKLRDLHHGDELYHIQLSSGHGFSYSPIDVLFDWLVLGKNGLNTNIELFGNGLINSILISFKREAMTPQLTDVTPDKQGKTGIQRKMEELWDTIMGRNGANKVQHVPELNAVHELGKDNKDMQFLELLDKETEKIFRCFGMSSADAGKDVTYNNAENFDYRFYNTVGKWLDELDDQMRNEWLLPKFGVITTETLYIEHNKPQKPGKAEEDKLWLEMYKNKVITLDEYRNKVGLPALTPQQKEELTPKVPDTVEVNPKDTQVSDVVDVKSKDKPGGAKFFTMAARFAERKTPTEIALKSKSFTDPQKGFLARWQTAIQKQLESYLKQIEKLEDGDLDNLEIKLPKIETFYSFPALKKDLQNFAGLGIDDFIENTGITKFFDGEYPLAVLEWLDDRVEKLLKGKKGFHGIDKETSSQIETIIRNNASKGVVALASIIREQIPSIAFERASLIAHTEVGNAVESTRDILYQAEFKGGEKEWQTSVYDVCPICTGNENQGRIPIDQDFKSGVGKALAHPNCRCTVLYYPAEEVAELKNDKPEDKPATKVKEPKQKKEYTVPASKSISTPSKDHIEAMDNYRGPAYKYINSGLRTNDLSDNYKKTVKLLDEATKMDQLDPGITLYRGVKGEFAQTMADLVPGTVIDEIGFASTSYDKNVANGFAPPPDGIVIEIINKKGAIGFDMYKNNPGSALAQYEKEFVLPRESKFKVVGKTKMKFPFTFTAPDGKLKKSTRTVTALQVELIV